MPYYQGDIVLVAFPFSNQSATKPRPAIIISNKIVNKTMDVIIAQITSNLRNDPFSFQIHDSDVSVSLRTTSEVRCHKLSTIDQTIIYKTISKLDSKTLSKLLLKINSFLS